MLLAIALPSCKKEYFELDRVKDNTWNPELAVPLIKSSVTVPEILDRFDDQDIITVDPNTGLLALRYFSTVFSITAEEWIELPGLNITPQVPITLQEINDAGSGGSNRTGTINIPFTGPNGENLSEIFLKGGNLDITLNSQVDLDAVVTITIPGLTLGATPYTTGPISVPRNGSNSATTSLTGRKLDLGLTGNPGEFAVNYSISYTGTGLVIPGDPMNINLALSGSNSLNGPTYSEMIGDFGQQSINVPLDTVRLRIFDNDAGGVIIWDSAIVRGTFVNTFGLSILADLPTFRVRNSDTGNEVPVTFPAGMLPMTLAAASAGYAPGLTNFELVGNTNGANVNTVLNLNPDRLIYQGDLTSNPGTGPFNNFMRDTSKLKLDIDVILPFDGRAIDFAQIDTADVKIFPLEGDIEEIVSVTLRLTLDNGFPADAFAQIYLLDTTGTILLDSLFSNTQQQIFESPVPGPTGIINQAEKVRTVTDIVVDREKLEFLEQNGFGKVVLLGWVDSFNNGQTRVKIFENYTMDMWLGMMVEAKVKVQF